MQVRFGEQRIHSPGRQIREDGKALEHSPAGRFAVDDGGFGHSVGRRLGPAGKFSPRRSGSFLARAASIGGSISGAAKGHVGPHPDTFAAIPEQDERSGE
jgi:hypothetical protein